MKKLLFALVLMAAAVSLRAQSFNNNLLAFQSNLKPEVYVDQWTNFKDNWTTQAKAAAKPMDNLLLMARLESNLRRENMSDNWNTIREQWLRELKVATTFPQLSKLLQQLESNVKPGFLTENWQVIKPKWVEELNAIK